MISELFTYDKPKVIQALRYHFITRREIKILLIFVNVFALFSAVLFFAKKVSPQAFLLSSFLWMLLMLVFWFVMPRAVYRRAQTFTDQFRAQLTPSGFGIENERGSRTWPWAEISTWLESPHFYHIYFNSRSFFLIPKEAFAGDAVHEARKLLAQYVPKQQVART